MSRLHLDVTGYASCGALNGQTGRTMQEQQVVVALAVRGEARPQLGVQRGISGITESASTAVQGTRSLVGWAITA